MFTDRVIFDMRGLYPGWVNVPRDERKAFDADRNVQIVSRQFAGFSATQHLLGNHRYLQLDLDADGSGTARVTSTMRAEHWCPEAAVGGASGRYTMFGCG